MGLSPGSLRTALAGSFPTAGTPMELGTAVAARVCSWLEANRAATEIEEVHYWAFNVEFVLKNGDYWAIECLSPEEFRMYPGFVRDDTVTWPNIWVRDTNMSLDELVKDINEVASQESERESNA